MSDFEMKDGSGMPEEERKLGSDGGFVSDTSCGSEYERHEGHSHSTDGERGGYSRSERDDYYTSGSGDGSFYRRDTSGMPSGGTSGGAAPSEEKKSTSGLAVASMVCGILSIVFACCIPYMGIILSIVGLVLGIVSQKKQKNGFSLAGIITSAFGLAFGIIALIIVIASFGNLWDFINSMIDSSSGIGDPYDPYDPNFGAGLNVITSIIKRLGL